MPYLCGKINVDGENMVCERQSVVNNCSCILMFSILNLLSRCKVYFAIPILVLMCFFNVRLLSISIPSIFVVFLYGIVSPFTLISGCPCMLRMC